MKRFATVLTVSIVLSAAGWAHASITVVSGDWVILSTGNGAVQYGDGGEFEVKVYSPLSNNSGPDYTKYKGDFYTFCCDINHVFVPGNLYEVSAVTSVWQSTFPTSLGGWLFANYWNNLSSNVSNPVPANGFVPGHEALTDNSIFYGSNSQQLTNRQVAGAIQDEIWSSLGFNPQFGSLASTADGMFGWTSAYSNWSPVNNGVLQLSLDGPNNNYGYGDPAQPQLYIPPPLESLSAVTPEPASMIIWSLLGAASWLGMRIWRRGRRVGRQSWSPENRQAIHDIIARGSPR